MKRGLLFRRCYAHVFQRRFYRGKNYVQADVNQVNSCERDHQIPANNDALVQDVIQNVKQAHFIKGIVAGEYDCVFRCAHLSFAPSTGRDTKE